MKTALIDIGSNTIRLVVYDGAKEIENVADYAGLISDVSEGEISAEGIFKIVCALNRMKKIALEHECDNIYAFATASLRDISDKDGLISYIYENTGINMEIISAEREAQYDFLGIRSICTDENGVAFDLGGGSCQIIVYEKNFPRESASFKIGSRKLYDEFVGGVLPSDEEKIKISRFVRRSISDMPILKGFSDGKEIYAMGGAVFALCSLAKKYFSLNENVLDEKILCKICTLTESEITTVVPKRLNTVIPAALTMTELIKYSTASRIVATSVGVRDGILSDKFGQKTKMHK